LEIACEAQDTQFFQPHSFSSLTGVSLWNNPERTSVIKMQERYKPCRILNRVQCFSCAEEPLSSLCECPSYTYDEILTMSPYCNKPLKKVEYEEICFYSILTGQPFSTTLPPQGKSRKWKFYLPVGVDVSEVLREAQIRDAIDTALQERVDAGNMYSLQVAEYNSEDKPVFKNPDTVPIGYSCLKHGSECRLTPRKALSITRDSCKRPVFNSSGCIPKNFCLWSKKNADGTHRKVSCCNHHLNLSCMRGTVMEQPRFFCPDLISSYSRKVRLNRPIYSNIKAQEFDNLINNFLSLNVQDITFDSIPEKFYYADVTSKPEFSHTSKVSLLSEDIYLGKLASSFDFLIVIKDVSGYLVFGELKKGDFVVTYVKHEQDKSEMYSLISNLGVNEVKILFALMFVIGVDADGVDTSTDIFSTTIIGASFLMALVAVFAAYKYYKKGTLQKYGQTLDKVNYCFDVASIASQSILNFVAEKTKISVDKMKWICFIIIDLVVTIIIYLRCKDDSSRNDIIVGWLASRGLMFGIAAGAEIIKGMNALHSALTKKPVLVSQSGSSEKDKSNEKQENDVRSALRAFKTLISGAFGFTKEKVSRADLNSMSTVQKALSTINSGRSLFSKIIDMIWYVIQWMYASIMGHPIKTEKLDRLISDTSDWIARVHKVSEDKIAHSCQEAIVASGLLKLLDEGYKLETRIIDNNCDRKIFPVFYKYFDKLIKYKFDCELAKEATDFRVDPFFIQVWGLPGCGKSHMTSDLHMDVQLALGRKAYAGLDCLYDKKQEEFWSKYNRKHVTARFDEALADGRSDERTVKILQFLDIISSASCPLDSAVAEEKGTKFFTSDFVMLVRNKNNFANITVEDKGAILRRISLEVEMILDEKYARIVGKEGEKRYERINRGVVDDTYKHCQFKITKIGEKFPDCDFKLGDTISYKQLVGICAHGIKQQIEFCEKRKMQNRKAKTGVDFENRTGFSVGQFQPRMNGQSGLFSSDEEEEDLETYVGRMDPEYTEIDEVEAFASKISGDQYQYKKIDVLNEDSKTDDEDRNQDGCVKIEIEGLSRKGSLETFVSLGELEKGKVEIIDHTHEECGHRTDSILGKAYNKCKACLSKMFAKDSYTGIYNSAVEKFRNRLNKDKDIQKNKEKYSSKSMLNELIREQFTSTMLMGTTEKAVYAFLIGTSIIAAFMIYKQIIHGLIRGIMNWKHTREVSYDPGRMAILNDDEVLELDAPLVMVAQSGSHGRSYLSRVAKYKSRKNKETKALAKEARQFAMSSDWERTTVLNPSDERALQYYNKGQSGSDFDVNKVSLIDNRVKRNIQHFKFHKTNPKSSVMTFITSEVAVTVFHLFSNVKPDDSIEFIGKSDFPKRSVFKLKELALIPMEFKDLMFIKFPKKDMPSRKNILEMFMKQEDIPDDFTNSLYLVSRTQDNSIVYKAGLNSQLKVKEDYKHPESDERIASEGCILASLPSVGGDCGAPMAYLSTDNKEMFVSIHIAGNGKDTALSTIVPREGLEKIVKTLENHILSGQSADTKTEVDPKIVKKEKRNDLVSECAAIKILEVPIEDRESASIIIPDNNEKVGCVEKSYTTRIPNTSKIHRSLLHGRAFPPTTAPAALRKFTDEEGNVVSPLQKALNKMSHEDWHISEEYKPLLMRCGEVMLDEIGTPSKIPRLLSYDEVINGSDEFPEIDRMNLRTSSGFPWTAKYRKKIAEAGGGKKFLLQLDSITGKLKMHEDLEEVVLEFEKRLRDPKDDRHKEIRTDFVDCLKDETRTLKKVKDGDTRLFSVAPIHLTILMRRYFGAFLDHVQSRHNDIFSKVGINVYSRDWDKLFYQLTELGDVLWLGFDYKKFDSTIPSELMEIAGDFINEFYSRNDPNNPEIDIDNLVRTRLLERVIYSIHLILDQLYKTKGKNPSGQPLTTLLNILVNFLILLTVFTVLLKEEISDDPADVIKVVRMAIFGDDNLNTFPRKYGESVTLQKFVTTIKEIFNMNAVDFRKHLKPEEWPKHHHADEVSFLKRTFKHVDGLVIAPLETDVIEAMPNHVTKTVNRIDGLRDNVETAMKEAVLHGKEYFRNYVRCVNGALQELHIKQVSVNFESMMNKVRHGTYLDTVLETNLVGQSGIFLSYEPCAMQGKQLKALEKYFKRNARDIQKEWEQKQNKNKARIISRQVFDLVGQSAEMNDEELKAQQIVQTVGNELTEIQIPSEIQDAGEDMSCIPRSLHNDNPYPEPAVLPMLERMYERTFTITPAMNESDQVFQMAFPEEIIDNEPSLRDRMRNYRFFRAGVRLYINIAAPKSGINGSAFVACLPKFKSSLNTYDSFFGDVKRMSLLTGSTIAFSENTQTIIEMPYMAPENYMDLSRMSDTEYSDGFFGTIKMSMLNPLRSVISGTTSDLTMIVRLQFFNISLAGPSESFTLTKTPNDLVGQSGALDKEQEEGSKSGVLGKVVSTAGDIGMVVTSIPPLERFKPIATGVSMVGSLLKKLGWSRPPDVRNDEPIVNRGGVARMMYGSGMDNYYPISVDPENKITTKPSDYGDPYDYDLISNFANIPGIIAILTIDSTTVPKSKLWECKVSPCVTHTESTGNVHTNFMTYASQVGALTTYSRGTMLFVLDVLCPSLNSIILAVQWTPGGTDAPDPLTDIGDKILKTYVITGNTKIQIAVPHMNASHYIQNIPNDLWGNGDQGTQFCNGTLAIYPISEITTSGDQTYGKVYVNVWASCSTDYKFAKPRSMWKDYVCNEGLTATQEELGEFKIRKLERLRNEQKRKERALYYLGEDETENDLVAQSGSVRAKDHTLSLQDPVASRNMRDIFRAEDTFEYLIPASQIYRDGVTMGENITRWTELLKRYTYWDTSVVSNGDNIIQPDPVRNSTASEKFAWPILTCFHFHAGGMKFQIGPNEPVHNGAGLINNFNGRFCIFPRSNKVTYGADTLDNRDGDSSLFGAGEGIELMLSRFRGFMCIGVPYYDIYPFEDYLDTNNHAAQMNPLFYGNFHGIPASTDFDIYGGVADDFKLIYPIPPMTVTYDATPVRRTFSDTRRSLALRNRVLSRNKKK
jgi:hypothetical protein